MRVFFRVINVILGLAAAAAMAFCGYMYYATTRFPISEYETQFAELKTEIAKTEKSTLEAKQETDARMDYLREDLSHLGTEGEKIAASLETLQSEAGEKQLRLETLRAEIERDENMPESVSAMRREYALKIRELEEKIQAGESKVKICYWTLDDGPTYITHNFLEALDEMDNVHVTFFTANQANDSPDEVEMLRQEMTSGHSVQNHSYGHVTDGNGVVYINLDSFREQVQKQDDWLYEATGFRPGIFRFPGGYFSWGQYHLKDAVDVLDEMGYQWVDWNCNLYDAGATENLPSSALELSRAITQISAKDIAIILGHDWNMNTLVAMKSAIPQLQERGYVFLPLFPESVTMGEATVAV